MIRQRFLPSFLMRSLIAALSIFGGSTGAQAALNIDHPRVTLQSLNKTTARISTFEMAIGETAQIGPLYIRPQACRTNPPTEEPESAVFLQIWTVKEPEDNLKAQDGGVSEATSEWVFSGWMFASSPGLSSMDHPVYDFWVLACDGVGTERAESARNADTENTTIEGVIDEPVVILDDREAVPVPRTPYHPSSSVPDEGDVLEKKAPADNPALYLDRPKAYYDQKKKDFQDPDAPIVHLD